jgi:hypothetical protein
MELLGRQQREAVGEVEAHLVAEDGKGADAGSVLLLGAFVEDPGEELEIGLHGATMAAPQELSKDSGSPANAGAQFWIGRTGPRPSPGSISSSSPEPP